tara:strand:- start:11 stop:2860 length:2850 start_codon:yes stop_codon:yes gene_type:complete
MKKFAIQVEITNLEKVSNLKEELIKLRKQQKLLLKEQKKTGNAGKNAAKQYEITTRAISNKSKELRNLNKNLKNTTSENKKVTKSSNGLAKQFVKGAAAIGIIVTAFRTVSRVVSSVVSTFSEFEFVMAKVNAISGATEQEFAALTASAEELGRTTFFTAEQVGQLQLNFSKLGFSADEIMSAQKATLDLATATGSDLARSATVAASAIRGFGLDASETQRVVDVMAVAFSTSALDIEKFQTSMTKVAPIAKAAGFSIEDTTTIMAKLSDAGIEASIAGTSLRNILLKMQDPSSDLSKSFGMTIHSLDELIPAMRNFSKEGGSMADVLGVVDLRQAAAFELMLANVDILNDYRNSLKESGGEAARMAGIVGDTLQGAFLRLKSATEGLAISIMKDFNEGLQSTTETLAKWGNFLSENSKVISGLIKVVMFLTKVVIAGYVAQKIATATVFLYNTALYAYIRVTKGATVATATFTTGVNTMKKALARTGIGLVVVGLGYLIEKFLLSSDAADKLTESTKKLSKEKSKINELLSREIADTKLVSDLNIKAYQDELKESKLRKQKAEEELKISNKRFFANQNTINQEKKLQDRLSEGIRLEKKYQTNRKKSIDQQKALETDLLYQLEQELKLIRERPAASEQDQKDKNIEIKQIEDKIKVLQNLGIEEEKARKLSDKYLPMGEDEGVKKQLEQQEILEKNQLELSEKYFSLQEEKGKQRLEMFKTFSDSIFSIIGNNAQRRADKEEKELEERKDSGVITQEQYEAQLLQVQKKAFERKKRMDIAQAIVNGALAMTKVTAQTGILAFGFSPFIAAMTAAQIAVIASQKFAKGGLIEKFADGGMVNGKSHAQGGEKFAVGGRVAELEGGEAVINKRSTAMFKSQLSAMNAAGGGVKFADGGLLNMPSFASSQFSAIGQQNMMGAMGQNNKVVVVESDITTSQNTVGLIEAEATF